MLVAVSSSGRRQVASAQVRAEQFSCPDCGNQLVVRLPATRVAHFAHLPGSRCTAKLTKAARRSEQRRQAAARRARRRDEEAAAAGQESLFEIAPAGPDHD